VALGTKTVDRTHSRNDKTAHLQENLWSSNFEFIPEEIATLTAEITAISITGERYPTPQTK